MARHGITIPFDGVPLGEHREWIEEIEQLGYTDVWSSEANGSDAFTPLTLASVWAPSLRLGTAIVPAYTRGPGTLAQTVGSLAQAAEGRLVLGIGSSSNVIVEGWNGIPFEKPYQRTRDVLRFLRAAMTGEKVTEEYETFKVRAGEYEAVYGNMPAFGLAAAASHVPVGRVANSAAARIGERDVDEPVVDPY